MTYVANSFTIFFLSFIIQNYKPVKHAKDVYDFYTIFTFMDKKYPNYYMETDVYPSVFFL